MESPRTSLQQTPSCSCSVKQQTHWRYLNLVRAAVSSQAFSDYVDGSLDGRPGAACSLDSSVAGMVDQASAILVLEETWLIVQSSARRS
jgi:hypothetical protein